MLTISHLSQVSMLCLDHMSRPILRNMGIGRVHLPAGGIAHLVPTFSFPAGDLQVHA